MSGTEEDPFAEFLSQDQAPEAAVYAQAPETAVYAQGGGGEMDANTSLRMLLESSQRKEQLLGKVCGLLVALDEKVARIASNQERLETTMQQAIASGSLSGGGGGGGGGMAKPGLGQPVQAGGSFSGQRGQLMAPPGKSPLTPGGGGGYGGINPAASAPVTAEQKAMEERLQAERIAEERRRIEEDAERRAGELARKREEDARRAAEEAERQRVEEARKKEEERQRKLALEKKTSSAMAGLLTGSTGSSLFGDEADTKKVKKGGLFDDD